MERLEILSADLIQDNPETVREVDRMCRMLGTGLGWHYILDITWILGQMDLPPGSTVVDAGAGNGVLQFALAERGYNVISVDFSDRSKPFYATRAFRIKDMGGERFSHEYIEHLETLGTRNTGPVARITAVLKSLKVEQMLLPFLWAGRLIGLRRPGTVTYYRADMSHMDEIEDSTVDAVVSVSAIEHMEKEKIGAAVREFERILKPGGIMAATTSAARDEDWFHEPSKGWCFTEKTLRDNFDLNSNLPSNYDRYDELFEKLRSCDRLRENLADFYFKSGNNGMPWGVWDPKYQPVGIVKLKSTG
jgi:ubiquinone/menaquinone biosynthesis C-methylase UbiE